jgi:uncharacterized membrane protein
MSARRDERGSIVVLLAVLLPLLLVVAAFGVDLGMQRVARRDMQALADAVALDLGRLVDGRSANDITSGTNGKLSLETRRANSVARNDDNVVGSTPTVTAQLINLDANGAPEVNPDGSVKVITGAAVPEAVLVTASTRVNFAFVSGSGGASRTAIANSQSVACFRLGSYALALNSSNSPILNNLIHDALNIQTLSYEGLANASVSLLGLSTELGAGTTDELLALKNVSLHDLFLASATVLEREGGDAADVDLLNTLATSVSSGQQVDISELLNVSAGSSAALAGNLNVLDLVSAAAFVSNGENLLDIPVLWNVPHLSSGVTGLKLIERPQLGCGRVGEASASTAQLKLSASLPLHLPQIAGLTAADVTVGLNVDLAGAEGLLTAVTCGEGTAASPESMAVRVSRALVSTLEVTAPVQLNGTIKLSVLGYGLVNVTLDLLVDAGVGTTYPALASGVAPSTLYAVPPRTYSDPEVVGTPGSPAIPSVGLTTSDVTGSASIVVLGIPLTIPLANVDLSSVLAAFQTKVIDASITPFITDVNDLLVPLTDLLGINIAGADLYGVPRPTCDSPALRG